MNKIHAIITGLLAAAVIYLFCQNCGAKSCSADDTVALNTTTDSTLNTELPKLAFLNVDTLNEKYQLVIDEEQKLADKESALSRNLEKKVKELENRFAELNAKGPTMLQSEIEAAQRELQEKELKIQELRNRSTEELQLATINAQDKFQKIVRKHLKEVADSLNLTAIFSNHQAGAALYSKNQLDITNLVINELNAKYKKEGK